MFLSFKLNKIIKKAVKKTVRHFKDRKPEIECNLFYGAVDISPRNLAIWYIFKTDSDLFAAKKSGLCDEIKKLTVGNLESLGYPEDAFMPDENGKKAAVCFASQEDVDKKADGDYRLYFQ